MTGLHLTAVAALCLATAFVAAAGCGKKSVPEIVRNIELPKIPLLVRDDPPTLRSPREVTLMPGEQTTVLVVVDRNGNKGPITSEVKDLPPGITATVEPAVDVDDVAKITLNVSADATLGDVPLDGRGSIGVTLNERFSQRDFKVSVPRVARVAIPPQPPLVIQPGTTTIWHVPVERHGFDEEIGFQAAPSTAALDVQASAVRAGESVLKLRVAIAPDAADGEAACSLQWISYGRPMEATLPVAIVRRPFALPVPVRVTLRRGEKREALLRVSRSGHEGPISLTIDRLPAGTQASPPGVMLEAEAATLVFSADESAREGVAIVPLRATTGHLMAKGLLTLRVVAETDRKSLPSAVVAGLPDRFQPGSIDARLSPEARRALADFYGATDECGSSVRESLRWLASAQAENGGWQSSATAEPSASARDPVALSALAVLPFLAEGITGDRMAVQATAMEPFAGVVEKAMAFLKGSQPKEGEKAGAIGSAMESHAFGLVALSEAFALTADDDLRKRARLAVDRLIAFQGKKGEWSVPGGDPARDTARAVVALQAARACGIGVPGGAVRKAVKSLEKYYTVDTPPGARFAAEAGLPPDPELTAACLLATECVQRNGDAPALLAGCDYLAEKAPTVGADHTDCSPLFLLMAGDALRAIEGEGYDTWNAAVRSFLTSNQVKTGPLAGSWDPDIFGGEADRVWATACATLCLQSHFRYLPLYRAPQKTEPKSE